MCGIAGILRISRPRHGDDQRRLLTRPLADAIPEPWLDLLDDSVRHRGPDGQGRFRDRALRADGAVVDIALVHRRLSIIDHAGGAQPMLLAADVHHTPVVPGMPLPLIFHGKPDDAVAYRPLPPAPNLLAVAFNGCIYNHGALRAELQSAGARFATDHSDTESILHAWRQWGDRAFDRIEGMFALALWDRASATFRLVRDAFGEKPLYYCGGQEASGDFSFAFASTHAALARYMHASTTNRGLLSRAAGLDDWLRLGFGLGAPGHFGNEVPPATCAAFEVGMPRLFVALNTQDQDRGLVIRRDTPLTAEAVERLVQKSVDARLEADVPLGCFLSGGVDSSLLALCAQRSLGSLQTFTVRMPDPRFDESEHAATVAAVLGTRHETLDCDPQPAADIVRLIEQIGLPFGDSSLLPAHWVSDAARRHVRVALSGDGGDELFLGYDRYTAAEVLRRRRWSVLKQIPARWLPQRNPRSFTSRLARLCQAAAGKGYLDLVSIFPTDLLHQLLGRPDSPHFAQSVDPGVDHAVAWDLSHYLPQDLLRKTDSASMACPVEVRSPLLDRAIVRAALSAPIQSLLPNRQRKGLLRAVARKYLPASVVDRPKQGFAIPLGDWFRNDFGGLKTLLLDHLSCAEPFGSPVLGIELQLPFIRRIVSEHMDGRRDHAQRLYLLLVLSIWARWLSRLPGPRPQ